MDDRNSGIIKGSYFYRDSLLLGFFFTLGLQASHSSRPARLQVECSEGNEVVSDVIILDGCAILWTLLWPYLLQGYSRFLMRSCKDNESSFRTRCPPHGVWYILWKNIKSSWDTRSKAFNCVFKLSKTSPLPKQTVTLTVSCNKLQIIRIIIDQLCSIQVPKGNKVVVTGPDPHPVEVGVGPSDVALYLTWRGVCNNGLLYDPGGLRWT